MNAHLPQAALCIHVVEALYFVLLAETILHNQTVARLHRACKEDFHTERSHAGILDQQPRTPRLLKVLENNSADGI